MRTIACDKQQLWPQGQAKFTNPRFLLPLRYHFMTSFLVIFSKFFASAVRIDTCAWLWYLYPQIWQTVLLQWRVIIPQLSNPSFSGYQFYSPQLHHPLCIHHCYPWFCAALVMPLLLFYHPGETAPNPVSPCAVVTASTRQVTRLHLKLKGPAVFFRHRDGTQSIRIPVLSSDLCSSITLYWDNSQ